MFPRPLDWELIILQGAVFPDLGELMFVKEAKVVCNRRLLGFLQSDVVMQVSSYSLESKLYWKFWPASNEDSQLD